VTPTVRRAEPADFGRLLEIRDRVAIDLLERGVRWNPNALTLEHLEDWHRLGVLWLAEIDGQVVGSVAVWRKDPMGYWPAGDLATYLRDLMTDPSYRHHGIGAVLLGWAERYSAGIGRSRVRLDCDAGNQRLCRYYQEAGYRQVATDGDGFALFEKVVTG
jgi:GNAT superfamily N-acetyltransferase